MADNSQMGSTTDLISTDDLTTLNGGAVSGVKAQRMKVGYGDDGTFRDASAAFPLPVVNRVNSLTVTTGSIVAATTTVTATTDVPNAGTITVVIGGTYAGVNVTFEASVDGTTWTGILGQRVDAYITETTSGALTNTVRAWDFPLPGFQQFRVRATAWTSGTAAIAIAPAVNAFEVAPTVGIAAGANTIGAVTGSGTAGASAAGVLSVQGIASGTTLPVTSTPAVPTTSATNSAASTNATSVKASAGTVYSVAVSNAGAAAAFVKLYNKASAPTVGTDVPVLTIPVGASSAVSLNLGALGQRFATGIALAITNLVADTDTTAVAANQVKALLSYA